MNKMEVILFDSAIRGIAWIIASFSVVSLWIDDFMHKLDDAGKLIITLGGIIAIIFLILSYYWGFRKKRAEALKAEKENKSD